MEKPPALRHGEAKGKSKTAEYNAWSNMRARCNNTNVNRYEIYGGRGIQICDRWNVFENFLKDMGRKPTQKHQLDRIDSNGDYEPENCRWALPIEQNNNTRRNVFLEVDGERITVAMAARKLSISETMIRSRLRRGWSAEDAISIPPRCV